MSTTFEQRLMQLTVYREVHGHTYLWKNDPEQRALRRWLRQQIEQYRKGRLDESRVQALKALDVDFEAAGAHWDRWESRYLELAAFARTHGHTNISQLTPGIGPWLSAQRVMYRQKTLAPARQQLLENLGVEWYPAQHNSERWIDQYHKLTAFLKENGHCNVSRRKFPDPGIWVSAQRTAYRKGVLTPERVLLLDAIGFEWSLRPGVPMPKELPTNRWIRCFQAVRENTGSLPDELARWLDTQRTAHSNAQLSAERSELLKLACLL